MIATTETETETVEASDFFREPAGVPFEAIENFLTACGLGENDQVQKVEITQVGVLVTCAFTVDGKSFTVDTPEGVKSPLVFYRAFDILRTEGGEHTHDDGTVHSHVPVEEDIS